MKAAKLAFSYRNTFQKDILIDLLCFRRWGHNELDDPTFTNPVMYKTIHSRQSVPDLYLEQLSVSILVNYLIFRDGAQRIYGIINFLINK